MQGYGPCILEPESIEGAYMRVLLINVNLWDTNTAASQHDRFRFCHHLTLRLSQKNPSCRPRKMDDQGTLSTKQAVIMFIIAKSSKPFAAVVCHSSFVCQIIIRGMVERNHSTHHVIILMWHPQSKHILKSQPCWGSYKS